MIKVSLKRSIDKLHICKFGNRITKINRTHWYNHLPSFGPAHLSITVTRRTPKLIFLDVHTDWPARLKHRLSTRKSEFWSWKINDQWWEQGRHVFRFLAVSVEPKKFRKWALLIHLQCSYTLIQIQGNYLQRRSYHRILSYSGHLRQSSMALSPLNVELCHGFRVMPMSIELQ